MTETTTRGPATDPGARPGPPADGTVRPPERVLVATRVSIRDARRWVLEPTSLELRTGQLLVAAGDPGHGHTALALALAGRLSGGRGTVTLDGSPSTAALQRSVALVDVPGVTEPDGAVPLATIAGEELAMAGRPARKAAVRSWLESNHLEQHVDSRVDELPPAVRVSALCRLAAIRPEIDFVVMVLPERGGDVPDSWVATARDLVAADFGVLVTASLGAARQLSAYDDLAVVALGNARDEQPDRPDPAANPAGDPTRSSEEDA